MTEKIFKYKAEGRDYDIPESRVNDFLDMYPNATVRANVDGRDYDIPHAKMPDFLKAYPNASYTLDSPLSTVVDTNYEPTLPESEEDAPEMSRRERRQERREERREARRNDDNTSIWETLGKGTGAAAVGTAKLALDLGRMAWRNSVLGKFAGGDFDDALQDESNPLTRASIKLGEVQERLSREADPTGGEKGFLDLLSEGKVGKAFQKALGSGIESLPMMLSAGTGIGAFLYGAAMAAGSYADETRENPDIPAWKRGINSAGSALLEMAVEKIGGPLKNLGGKAGKEVTEEMAQEILRKVAKEGPEKIGKRILRGLGKVGKQSVEEGGEEFLTSFGNDALGEALDLIDGDKDYGIRAQWEQVKSENPDADAWDFALAKGKEYVDSFLGGAMSGLEISGVEQLSSGGLRLNAERKARKMFDDARSLGSSLNYGDIYDSDDTLREQMDAVAATFTNEKGEAGISNEFIGALSSEDAFALSRREDFSPEQRNALFGLARAKAIQEGLTAKLDEGVESLVSEERMRIEGAIENGSVITAEYNGKQVYVKGAANVGDGTVTAPGGQNGPVVIIDANTGEQSIVRSEEVQFAESHNPDEYARDIENAIRSNDARTREIARNTMSVRAKAKAVKPFAGKKILVDVGNGLTEVLVQQISPNGDVIIKGKKGDLGGQSVMTLSAGAFYDSIYRDEDGNPVITEAPQEAEAETPQEEAPIAEVTGDEDYRGQTIPILLNGVPTEVEVMSQDNPSDSIVYEYTDASGNRRTASSTIGAFNAAIQQAAEYVAPTPTAEETPSVETVPADSETQAPQEVPVTPENIDWDALFEQDPWAYFSELQNQFGDGAIDFIDNEIAATEEEIAKLEKRKGDSRSERVANLQKKSKLKLQLGTLYEMRARLKPSPSPTTGVPVAPDTTAESGQTTAPIDPNVPDFSSDRASDARTRGYRVTSGQRVDRRGETAGTYGNDIEIAFTADSKGKRSGKVKVIDAGSLVPSHIRGVENVEHFLPEAQPKKRTDNASAVSASLIAQNMNNPQMTTVTTSAYEGAPIVNRRGEVIQGNNRSAALLEMYQSHPNKASEYRQYLIDHASEFGLDANEISAMQNPVLVRELDVEDTDAINLGQYTMQDMESGGNQSIDAGRAIAGLNNKGMMEYFVNTLLAEENDESSDMNISDLITRNGVASLKLLYAQGIINQTQYQSALGSDGRVTADARASLRGIIEQQLFAGGIDSLGVMFEVLPDKAKKAIMQTIARDIKNAEGERVTPYIQQAIEIYYHLNQQKDFVSAKDDADILAAIETYKRQTSFEDPLTPAEKYSNFAFRLAFLFKARTLKEIRAKFNALYDEMSEAANLFAAGEGKSLAEAVQEVYGITLNSGNYETDGQGGADVLGNNNGESSEGGQGSDGGVGVRTEAGEGGQRTSDGGTDSPVVGGSTGQAAGEVAPVAPNPVDNPAREAQKREKALAQQLQRYGISPEQKSDMAFNAGKAVGDFFATREEYDAYAENATDLGDYNADFERGVEASFANRQQNVGNSPVNSVPLETEPNEENNGEEGTSQGTIREGQAGVPGSEQTYDEGAEEGASSPQAVRGSGADNSGLIEDRYPARKGDITRQELAEAFGLNSVSPAINQEVLNSVYDFMMEMSKMLGISPKSIGHGATLGVKTLKDNSRARAQYSFKQRIDGTIVDAYLNFKNSKLSSIAHEWFHSLDQALSYYETGKGKRSATNAIAGEFAGRKETLDAIKGLINAINKSGHKERLKKELWFNKAFLRYSLRKDEMTARAFEEYIRMKFAEAGIEMEGLSENATNHPTSDEMAVIAPAFDNLFKVLQEKEGKTPGTSVLYHIGEIMEEESDARQLATEAVLTALDDNGIDVVRATDEQTQQMLDVAAEVAEMQKGKAPETVSVQDEHHQTVISSADGAKVINNTDILQTPNGTVYGWTDGKKIYLTEAGINPNTPIHEYTHLWANAMMQKNPKGWNSIKKLLKGTPVWNEVMSDPNYSSIHNDEDAVASEALSRISGKENAAKMEQMAQKMIDDAKGTARKLEARGLVQNMRDALNRFWEFVWKDLFKMGRFISVEHVTDRILFDLLNGTDLGVMSEGQVQAQIVTDPEVIAKLEASPKRTGYRNVVQNEDGTFSSPMAYWLQGTKEGAKSRVETAKFELGKWEEAEEHPELVDEKGHVVLVKPNKSTVEVAYDPYIHNRLDPVNLQFKDAWKRDELVYVETVVPETDLESGYHADQALLPVGVHSWSNGDVMLSKYDKPVRIMPWEAVADAWVERLNGNGVHFDVVPPALRSLLVERGVEILPPHKGMGKDCNDAYEAWKKENEIALSRKGKINANFVEQFEFKQNNERQELEYSDEFRRLQEESSRMSGQLVSEKDGVQQAAIRGLVGRIGGTLQRELDRATSGRGNKLRTVVNESKGTSFDIIENVDGRLFHDIFEIVRAYLPNGELVDLHDNYDDAICYITSDGLAGFAVSSDGNLISVYSLYGKSKKGFLGAIKDLITEAGATHLDGYNSRLQPLAEIYSKVFGWKVASMMDYNMEYDHDNIAENHGMPQVAFMVNTDADIETRHFDKDQYDDAVAYQLEQVAKSKENSLSSQSYEGAGEYNTASDGRGEGVQEELPVLRPALLLGAGSVDGEVSQADFSRFNPISKRDGESDRQRNNRENKFLSFFNRLTSEEQTNLYIFLKDYSSSPSGILRGRATDFINSIRQKGNNDFADFVEDFINDELKYREGVSSAAVARHGLLVGVDQNLNALERMFYAFNKDQYNGVLFDRVLKLAKRFGVTVKFATRNADGSFISEYGSYNPNDNSITLDANLLVKGSESELCQTIVHELIHSVVARAASIMTGRAVDKNNQFIDPQSLPKDVVDGINTLKEVYEAIKDDGTFQDTYGKKDFEEMLSEITDPKFRGLLKAKKLWKKFLNGICKLLGIADESSSESDALTEIESAIDNILSAAERGELDSAYASYLGQLADGYTLADLQRLGSGPVKTLLTQNVLFRTGIDVDTMATETAKEVYGRAVKARWQEFQRQFQDAMQPVRIAIDAIQQETGNIPIEDYENYLLIKNQASSRSRVEIDNFGRRHFDPILKQVNKIIDQIMKSRGWKVNDESKRADVYAEVKQYLIAKHGLERNELYQTTKTRNLNIGERTREINNAQKIYDDKVNQINLDASLTDAERQLQLREALDAYNATLEEIRTRQVPDVRDYSGLTALFGLEAKEYVEAERLAQELVDNFENEVSTDELWAKINAATNKTLRHSYECGLLSRSQYEQIRDMFQYYIPLRGFDETTAEDVYSYLRFESNSFSPAVKEAKGRTSIADDPLAYIMTMAESEITQGNNNRAKQALYNFILNRASATGKQNTLMQVEDVWYVKSVDANGKASQQIAAPNHAAGETYEEFEVRMTALEAAGNAFKSKKGQVDVGMRFQVKRNQDAHYVYLKVNGVEKAIYINGDPKAADAINGRYAEKPGRIEEKMREANRLISSTFTNYSLEFTLRNFTRDMIYANINLAIKEPDPAYRRKFRRNWAHNNMGTMIKMLQAYRAGEFEGRTDLNEDEAAFVEFMENGGQTGYTLINSVESRKKDLERAIKRMQNGIDKGGVKDSTVFRYTLGGIELLNEASELVTRFAAFKTSRDMGRSILRSESDAKEITVNFNTKGAQDGKGWMGMLAKWFGATRFFFNASVQGIQNVKAMANANKFKFGGVVAGLVASGFLMPILQGMLIELLGGDDDWYWDIPEYDRQSCICIVIGEGKYVKIPLPVGLNKMYAIGDTVASWVFDKKHHHTIADVGMEVANLVASTILPVNPLEGTVNELSLMQSVVNAVAPSSTQAVIQNLTNTDWKGAPIQKEYTYNRNDPQWEKAYSSNPAVLKALSKWCYENVKLDGWFRGWDWSPEYLDNTLSNLGGGIYSLIKKTGNAISMIWNEDARELSKVPLVGVFFGTTDDRFGYVNEAYYDLDEEFNSEVNPIKKTAKAFGYSLDEVFKPVGEGGKRAGDHHPKMQKDVYGNRHFEHMQAWYLGQKKLDSINDEIEKQEKKMAKMENPPQGEIDKMTKLQAEYETTRTELVNGMLESKYEQIIDKFRK